MKFMVALKVINHYNHDYIRETKNDILKFKHNYNIKIHPFSRSREYTRAFNAIKLNRLFSKPFIYSFDEHKDSVWRITKSSTLLTSILSGSCDGEICCWNLSSRKLNWKVQAHKKFVRGLCIDSTGNRFLSTGSDKKINIWSMNMDLCNENYKRKKKNILPLNTFISKYTLTDLTCSYANESTGFATSGLNIELWVIIRSKPIHSFDWNGETFKGVRFNPIEHDVLCSWSSDRKLVIYDVRIKSSTSFLTLKNQINDIEWNPREPFTLSLAASDHNAYTFDIRSFKKARKIHMGHVKNIQAISYSPTGNEFVTGSFDSTIRIYKINQGISREVYYTKRMQKIYSVCYTVDNRFILSGSDDHNVRLWKANASEVLNKLKPAEEHKINYFEKLITKFHYIPVVKSIEKYRHLPRWVKLRTRQCKIKHNTEIRKEKNRVSNSRNKNYTALNTKRKIIIN